MPGGSLSKMVARKKARKRRRAIGSETTKDATIKNVLVRYNSPFSNTMVAKHNYYNYNLSVNPGLISAASFLFSANGLYDPNITGTGHQPMGFDQLSAVYDHYMVIGSKITVTFVTGGTQNCLCGIRISDTNAFSNDPETIVENGSCVWTLVPGTGSGENMKTLSYAVNPSKYLGSKDKSELKGDASSNPVEQCFFQCFAFSNSASDPAALTLNVFLEYTAIWTEPKALATS